MRFPRAVFVVLGVLCVCGSVGVDPSNAQPKSLICPSEDSGLKLPAGFCATIFADNIGHARHLVVAPDGTVYVNTWSGAYYPAGETPHAGGFLVALQDKGKTGKADVIERFGESVASGGAGGTGIALYKGSIYAENNDRILRYGLTAGSIVPQGQATTVVTGLPLGGDHPMHPFAIDADGAMYIDVGTASNACQLKNRTLKSPGADPCIELETQTRPTSRLLPRIDSLLVFATLRVSRSTQQESVSTSRNMAETSSMPIGLTFTSQSRRQRCLRKSFCC
jgi:glucose/arabinose dehydrogenase